MDREQLRRAASREIYEDPEGENEVMLKVTVSGECVELHRQQEMPWDNADGTGYDWDVSTWHMSKDTLKRFIEAAQIAIKQSEAFERSNPHNLQVFQPVLGRDVKYRS